jgi:hypothetical protein
MSLPRGEVHTIAGSRPARVRIPAWTKAARNRCGTMTHQERTVRNRRRAGEAAMPFAAPSNTATGPATPTAA